MKALYIILGVWILLLGICVMFNLVELNQFATGMYITCLGIMTISEGVRAWRSI